MVTGVSAVALTQANALSGVAAAWTPQPMTEEAAPDVTWLPQSGEAGTSQLSGVSAKVGASDQRLTQHSHARILQGETHTGAPEGWSKAGPTPRVPVGVRSS